jgi:hypothetical protein
MTRPLLAREWEWVLEIGTVVLGVAVVVGLVLKWPKPSESLTGVWESRSRTADGGETVRTLTFAGPNGGWWRGPLVRADTTLVGDSLAFSVEGPRENRFCIRMPPGTADCLVLGAYHDSLILDPRSSTYGQARGAPGLLFRRKP